MDRLDNLRKEVLEISEKVKNGLNAIDIKNSHKEFFKTYPYLFKMINENGEYMEILDRMIDAAKAVQRGESTADEMDKHVGTELAKEYIYPHIDLSKEL